MLLLRLCSGGVLYFVLLSYDVVVRVSSFECVVPPPPVALCALFVVCAVVCSCLRVCFFVLLLLPCFEHVVCVCVSLCVLCCVRCFFVCLFCVRLSPCLF